VDDRCTALLVGVSEQKLAFADEIAVVVHVGTAASLARALPVYLRHFRPNASCRARLHRRRPVLRQRASSPAMPDRNSGANNSIVRGNGQIPQALAEIVICSAVC